MSKPLSERYIHYDATGVDRWTPLLPSADALRAQGFGKYVHHLTHSYAIAPGSPLEVNDSDERLAAEAAAFIEQTTGLEVSCGLGKYTRLQEERNGVYDSSLHAVAVREYSTGTQYGDTVALGSVLVHEMMHSTAVDTAKVLDIETAGAHGIYTLQPHHVTEITPSFDDDHFFEEGLAEEIASRWRMQFDTELRERDRDLLGYGEHSPLPVRMYMPVAPIDMTTRDGERGVQYPAFCSFGIQLLSEYTGVDLIDLLIQARKPETQASASERLRQTVDSVEPGLYDILTSAHYSVEDFEDCLKIIKIAIANHALTHAIDNKAA